jgi:hypothetical protein
MVDLSGLTILKEAILATIRSKKKTPAKKKAGAPEAVKAVTTVKLKTMSGESSLDGAYENASFCFAACTDLDKGNITQITNLAGCREGFIRQYRDCALENASAQKPSKRRTSMIVWVSKGNSTNAYDCARGSQNRLSMTYEDWMEKSMKIAVMMLNKFEARNKWMRTKVYKTTHVHGNKHIIYYFRGTRWWQFAPHTMSLFMLLIRLSKHISLHSMQSNVTPETIIKNIMAIKSGTDQGHAQTAKYWLTLMDNRRKIYDGRSFKDNWEAFQGGSEGIRMLTDNRAADKQSQARFNKFK